MAECAQLPSVRTVLNTKTEAGGGGIMGRMRNCPQSRSGRDLDVGCFQERTAAAKTLI